MHNLSITYAIRRRMRVFAISDLHTDYDANARWLRDLSREDYKADILLLGGDVSDDPRLLEECFRETSTRFKDVFYVPGNHDLWVVRWDKTKTSFDKLALIEELAHGYGVRMGRCDYDSFSIVPLLAWYDYSFGTPDDRLHEIWMDYHACRWPAGLTPADVTHRFLSRNEAAIAPLNTPVISFSHFLPRLDVMPDYIPSAQRAIYPVLGTRLLDEQVRRLGATTHVYGHSHVNRRVRIDGVDYINNAFGYPGETRIARRSLVAVLDT